MPIPGFTLGTDYSELDGSGKLSLQGGKLRGTRLYRVFTYRNGNAFISALAGGIQFGTPPTYNTPHQYQAGMELYCTGAELEGKGTLSGDADGPNYDGGAWITATYETLNYDPSTGGGGGNPAPAVYVTERRSSGGQTLTLTKTKTTGENAWKFLDFGSPISIDAPEIVKIVPQGEYIITRHFVPTYNQSEIDALIGKINDASFPTSSSLGGYAAGTLLFLGDEANREYTADGAVTAWESVLRFSYNPNGWNYGYNPLSQNYEKIISVDDANVSPYEAASFNTLLT